MVDGENSLFEYELNIVRVVSYLELGEKVVICCRAGVSRSNAIALGVLVHYFKIDFNRALELTNYNYVEIPICDILPINFTDVFTGKGGCANCAIIVTHIFDPTSGNEYKGYVYWLPALIGHQAEMIICGHESDMDYPLLAQ
jgi:hypothetical protein